MTKKIQRVHATITYT